MLSTGVKSLNWLDYKCFMMKRNAINWKAYPWKQAGSLSTILISLYLLLTSAWLLFEENRIEQQLTAQSNKVDQALLFSNLS